MKTNWLRGMLLGVSLALLLAGGVALAQGLSITVDPACIECWNGAPGPDVDPPEAFIAEFVATGFDPDPFYTCGRMSAEGEIMFEFCGRAPEGGTSRAYLSASCPEYANRVLLWMDQVEGAPTDYDLVFGDWSFRVWQENRSHVVTNGPVTAHLQIARSCEQAAEFVPEPGTIALLGTGLAGLAGYATLRWRSRR
jgi:hypothetical protein